MKLYKVLSFIFRPLIALLYPTKIIGRENIPEGKAIVVCNHYSNADAPIMITRVFKKGIHYLAKKEIFKGKLKRWFVTKMGAIEIDRENPSAASMKEIFTLIANDQKIVIFPEGTRNKSGSEKMLPLKYGSSMFSIKTKTPVLPMVFLKKPKLFRKNYLVIGQPFELTEYYGTKEYVEATALIESRIYDCRSMVPVKKRKGKKDANNKV